MGQSQPQSSRRRRRVHLMTRTTAPRQRPLLVSWQSSQALVNCPEVRAGHRRVKHGCCLMAAWCLSLTASQYWRSVRCCVPPVLKCSSSIVSSLLLRGASFRAGISSALPVDWRGPGGCLHLKDHVKLDIGQGLVLACTSITSCDMQKTLSAGGLDLGCHLRREGAERAAGLLRAGRCSRGAPA